MKNNNMLKNPIQIINGISFFHAGKGKWQFDGLRPDNTTFTKIEAVGGRLNAEKTAVIIGASLKRNFVGSSGLDPMARGQLVKVFKPKTYNGNNMSHAGHHITGNH